MKMFTSGVRSFMAFAFAIALALWLAACDQSVEHGGTDAASQTDADTDAVAVGDGAGDAAPGLKVTVTYHSVDHEVDLSTLAQATTDAGMHVVLLADIVLQALPGTDLAGIGANFASGDGFNPLGRPSCAELLPVSGSLLSQGYVDPSTRNLLWSEDLGYPSCMYVKDLAQIQVVDP
jgi:hypothetical protein